RTVIERALHAAFGVCADVIWSLLQPRLHLFQIEQVVGPTSYDHARLSREHIEEGCHITVQAIQSHKHRGGSKPKVCGIAGDGPDRSSQFPPIIPIACSAKRGEQLMSM